jgi:hypothetical protein
MTRFTSRHLCAKAFVGLMLGALLWSAFTVLAGEARPPAVSTLEPIVVTGNRFPESVPDEVLTRQVKTALHDDPFFYDEHVSITVTHGIVRLEGMVLDAADIRDVLRIIKKKFPGVKRVVNELEICREDSDDG